MRKFNVLLLLRTRVSIHQFRSFFYAAVLTTKGKLKREDSRKAFIEWYNAIQIDILCWFKTLHILITKGTSV